MAHRYEIYKDKIGDFRVRFKYNSETIWSSEGFSSKNSAMNLIESLKRNAPSAPIEDPTNEIDDLRRRLQSAPIPAADRIVDLNHNSAAFKEFKAAFKALEKSVRTSNDFGDMSAKEVEVARSEVGQFSAEKEQLRIRPAHLWQVAKSTFLWLADHAAGAAIGTLALTALAALARLLGISI